MKKLAIPDGIPGRRIRCNQQILSPNGKGYASVVFIGDVHIGSPQCDETRFRAMLDHCLEKQYYVMLMGDLIENATRMSVGAGVYEQIETPQSQFERLVEMLRPLAEAKLILGSLRGNHEFRTWQLTGVDISKAICRELRIPYLGDACWNVWKVGKTNYYVYTLHGASGSRYDHTKLKAITDISHGFDCSLIAMGHVHTCADVAQLVQYVDPRTKTIKERKKWCLITGHYLGYDGGYAQMKGMPIAKLGSPKVKFFEEKLDIHISW